MSWLLALLVGLVLALLLTPVVEKIAPRIGALDRPALRRVHEKVTPTGGGLAIFAAFWLAVVVGGAFRHTPEIVGIFVGSVVLVAVCLADDIRKLHWAPRLVSQIIVAIIVIQWGVRIEGITNPLALWGGSSYLVLGRWSGPLTVFWIVFMINAINWIDGLDGLAAGVCTIAAATFTIMAVSGGLGAVAVLGAAMAGACLGFLPYNFNPARIFMGDTGAMFLGYMLAYISISGPFKSTAVLAVLVPFLVMGVPIYDTLITGIKRITQGKPVYNADRTHLHHRLLDRGLSVTQTVLIYYAITGVLCALALGLWGH